MPATSVARMAASYNGPVEGHTVTVGAGHAREQKGTGIGSLLVPEQKTSPAWRLYALGCSYRAFTLSSELRSTNLL